MVKFNYDEVIGVGYSGALYVVVVSCNFYRRPK